MKINAARKMCVLTVTNISIPLQLCACVGMETTKHYGGIITITITVTGQVNEMRGSC